MSHLSLPAILTNGEKIPAAEIPIIPHVEEFALEDANMALAELKNRKIRGGKVLKIA